MSLFNFFRPRGRIVGRIVVTGLPPHHQFNVSAAILEVGNIPQYVSEYRDIVTIKDFEDPADKPLEFSVRRRVSEYFIAVNLMVLFQRGERFEVQTEWVFPMKDPICMTAGVEHRIEIPAAWPTIPPQDLQDFGTVHPDGRYTPPSGNA